MAALDIELEIYNKLWALFEADAGWAAAFPAGNRIKYNVQGSENPQKPAEADGDYPSAQLDCVTGTSTLHTQNPTFGMFAEGFAGNWIERQTYTFKLHMVSRLMRIQDSTSARRDALNAMRKAGPRIGLPYIVGVSTRWESRKRFEDPEDEQGFYRDVSDVYVSIAVETDGQSLTGA